MVRARLQPSFLRPLDTTPAKTQHDDITPEMFEGGKCNPIFLFIYFKQRMFKQFLGEGKKCLRSEEKKLEHERSRSWGIKSCARCKCQPQIAHRSVRGVKPARLFF